VTTAASPNSRTRTESARISAQNVISSDDSAGSRDEEVFWGEQLAEGGCVAGEYSSLKAVVRRANGAFIGAWVGRILSGETNYGAREQSQQRGTAQRRYEST